VQKGGLPRFIPGGPPLSPPQGGGGGGGAVFLEWTRLAHKADHFNSS